jgi:hypothetical protein
MTNNMGRLLLSPLLLLVLNLQAMAQPPSHFMGARWGMSIEETREVIRSEAKRVTQDDTKGNTPVLYAKGIFLGSQANFSYFFTPKSKRLYRVDVTFNDSRMYEKVKAYLTKRFKGPTSSQQNMDQWMWGDKGRIDLKKEPGQVLLSYSSSPPSAF